MNTTKLSALGVALLLVVSCQTFRQPKAPIAGGSGTLEITIIRSAVSIDYVQVYVDGDFVGAAPSRNPMKLTLPAGRRTIRVEAEETFHGKKVVPFERVILILGGDAVQYLVVRLRLAKE